MAHVAMRRKTTTEVPHNQYLQRRRQGWYLRVAVPPSLQPAVRKAHIVRSLKTRDVAVARERRWEALAEVRKWLREQGTPEGHWFGPGTVDPVAEGLADRDWWASADNRVRDPDTRHTERQTAKLVIADRAEEIEAKQGLDAASTYFRIATSEDPVLAEAEKRWLQEVAGAVSGQTLGHHRFALKLLHEYDASLMFVGQVDRRFAGSFVSEALRPGRQPKTVNRIISSLSSFWAWMKGRGLTEVNPWSGQGEKRKDNGRQARPKRPYTPSELLRLLHANPVSILGERYGHAINDLLRLGLMTGARLNELCELMVEDVDLKQRTIWIRRGKTEAAKRIIPVHPSIWPIVTRRTEAAQGGALFPELPPQGPDEKRSWYTSKRFTEFRRRVLGEDDSVDFHSLRRAFATYLDHAQGHTLAVHPGVIAELMGHEKGTLALSVYSGGHRIEHLRKAIDALGDVVEPEVLEAVVTTQGG
jgi:integrase